MSNKTQLTEAEVELQEEDTLKDKYLTFHIGGEDYGISIRHVIEIIGIQKITEVPESETYIKGVINLRGKVIPIMDIRLRFGMEAREYDERTCFIVVNVSDRSIGLVVDTVSDVASIPEESIELTARQGKGYHHDYIHGLGKTGEDIKILLDVNKLLFEDDALPNNENNSTDN